MYLLHDHPLNLILILGLVKKMVLPFLNLLYLFCRRRWYFCPLFDSLDHRQEPRHIQTLHHDRRKEKEKAVSMRKPVPFL